MEPRDIVGKDWKQRLIHAAQCAVTEIRNIEDSKSTKGYPLMSKGNPRSEKWIDGVSCGLRRLRVLEWMLAAKVLGRTTKKHSHLRLLMNDDQAILRKLRSGHKMIAQRYPKVVEEMKERVVGILRKQKDRRMWFKHLLKRCSKIKANGRELSGGEVLMVLECIEESGAITMHCINDPPKENTNVVFTKLYIRLKDEKDINTKGEDSFITESQSADDIEEPPRKKRKIDGNGKREDGDLEKESNAKNESAESNKMEEFFARRMREKKMQQTSMIKNGVNQRTGNGEDGMEKRKRRRKRNVVKTGGEGRYQRVRVKEMNDIKDNRYDGKDQFAKRAYTALSGKKGKMFVKAKNKQKLKTNHGGGPIDKDAVNSIRFDG